VTATTGFNISVKYFIQIISAFIRPGDPISVMYSNLYGNSTTWQVLYMLQGYLHLPFFGLMLTTYLQI
jgi:hypothetical protein